MLILKRWQWLGVLLTLALVVLAVWPRQSALPPLGGAPGVWREALPLLEQDHRLKPRDEAVIARLEEAYEKLGRPKDALNLLESVTQWRALQPGERNQLKRLALAEGDAKRALRDLLPARGKMDDAELQGLTELALAAPDLSTAYDLQSMLVAHRPDDWGARERLVTILTQSGRTADALNALEQGGPGSDELAWHRKAAQLAFWSRQPGRAVPHLQALYQREHSLETGQQLLGAMQASGNAGLMDFAQHMVADFPHERAVRKLAAALLVQAKQNEPALALFRDEVSQAPTSAAAHTDYVNLALAQQRLSVAVDELRRWSQARPSDALAWHQLGVVLAWDKRPLEALQAYEHLLEACPTPSQRIELAWRRQAAALAGAKEDLTPFGRHNLTRLVAMSPRHILFHRRLARVHAEAGELAAAVAEQRRILALPDAAREDRVQLMNYLFLAHRTSEAVEQAYGLDRRQPLTQQQVAQVAYAACNAKQWKLAAYFLARRSTAHPRDVNVWETLARVRESAGDTTGALKAWRTRLALGKGSARDREGLVALLIRAGRKQEALSMLERVGTAHASLTELREWSSLAYELQRPDTEEQALRQLVKRVPGEGAAWAALGGVLDQRDASSEADACFETALRLAPHEQNLWVQAAARRFYSARAESAAPIIEKLATWKNLSPRALRLLADHDQIHNPARALRWLNALEALKPDAEVAFRRGEVAAALGAMGEAKAAWEQAVARGAVAHASSEDASARATALERLGRDAEAVVAWKALSHAYPNLLAPPLALAHAAMRAGHYDEAGSWIQKARLLAPAQMEPKLLRLEWLEARGDREQALAWVIRLRGENPKLTYLAAREAQDRFDLGQLVSARRVAREALARAPSDDSLAELYRNLRQEAGGRMVVASHYEQSSTLQASEVRLTSVSPVNENTRLIASLSQLNWGASNAQEAALGGDWRSGPWSGVARMAIGTSTSLVPYGKLGMGWQSGPMAASATLEETRWEDSAQALAAGARDRHLRGDVSWQANPHLSLRAGLEAGQLLVADGGSYAGRASAEVGFQPAASGPLGLYYQFQHRQYGAAGPAVGLPVATDVHTALLRYANHWGPWRAELAPGYSVDLLSGAQAPLVSGSLGFEPTPDLLVNLSGAWSSRSVLQGGADAYRRLELQGSWFF